MAAKKKRKTKRKATAKQLAALAKGRATIAKKRRKAPAKKRKAPSKKRASVSLEYFVFARKGNKGTKYYLQKIANEWRFDSSKPSGMTKTAAANALKVAKRFIKRLPSGMHVYQEILKKKR